MPPKKEVVEERLGPWALGKFSSRLKVLIVAWVRLPKSLLFCCSPSRAFSFLKTRKATVIISALAALLSHSMPITHHPTYPRPSIGWHRSSFPVLKKQGDEESCHHGSTHLS
eukprot:3254555-Rhodomonas_salina.1